jgi:glutathione dehydrogenase/transferase
MVIEARKLGFALSVAPRVRDLRLTPLGYCRTGTTAMSAEPPKAGSAVLYIKAGEDGQSIGDCPFSMKANLALRLKGTPADVETINFERKPDWFLELNPAGTTPVYVAPDGEVIESSDEIVALADETGPDKNVRLYQEDNPYWASSVAAVGPVFGTFAQWMKNKEADNEEKLRGELLGALEAVEGQIGKSGGPFLLGKTVSALDCNFGPKLHHILVAGKHYKRFDLPERFENLRLYMSAWTETPEWNASSCPEETVVWGWSKFFK